MQIYNPSPLPSLFKPISWSKYENYLQSLSSIFYGMPTPVSITCTLIIFVKLESYINFTVMLPSKVYLIELLIRLIRICFNRFWSVYIYLSLSSTYTLIISSKFLNCIYYLKRSTISLTKSLSENNSLLILTFPYLIYEMSSISIIRW